MPVVQDGPAFVGQTWNVRRTGVVGRAGTVGRTGARRSVDAVGSHLLGRLGGEREPHRDHHSLPGRRRGRDGAVMGGDDRRHDGKTEAAAPSRAGARRIGAVEALEDAARVVCRHAGTAVAHLDLSLAVHLFHPHGGRRAGRGVGAHVGQEVVHHLPQAVLVPDHLDGQGRPKAQRPLRADRSGGTDRLRDERDQLDRCLLHGQPLVEAGQREEIAHQAIHARRLRPDARCDAGQVVRVRRAATLEQFGVGGHGRDGRAQFV